MIGRNFSCENAQVYGLCKWSTVKFVVFSFYSTFFVFVVILFC